MRFVIQRVTEASVTIDGEISGKIGKGYLVLIGVADTDTKEIADKMIRKMIGLRIFEDENGKSDVLNFLEEIRLKSKNNKNYRIQYRQIMFYINLLKENGSTLNSNIMKKIFQFA